MYLCMEMVVKLVLVGETTETQADKKKRKESKSGLHAIICEGRISLEVHTSRLIGKRTQKGQSC